MYSLRLNRSNRSRINRRSYYCRWLMCLIECFITKSKPNNHFLLSSMLLSVMSYETHWPPLMPKFLLWTCTFTSSELLFTIVQTWIQNHSKDSCLVYWKTSKTLERRLVRQPNLSISLFMISLTTQYWTKIKRILRSRTQVLISD